MSHNQALVTPEKVFDYQEVKRTTEQDQDERYFRDCEDECLELSESTEEDF